MRLRLAAALAQPLVVISLAGLTPACRCSDDRPYTPFGVTTALPAPAPPALPTASSSAAGPPGSGRPIEKALLAPLRSKRWSLAGRELSAPADTVFEQAVVADFDADTHAEVVAFVLPDGAAAQGRAPGELWLYRNGAEARKIASVPGFVPTAPDCKLVTALGRTGPRTVTLDTRATCPGALIARSPVRAVVVLNPLAERAEVLSLRVADAAPGETLELLPATDDRDTDGRDDVSLTLAAGIQGKELRFEAPFVWLDRAIGPARDTTEPRRALERLAARELARAKTKKLAEAVLESVAGLRRLAGALCAEGAASRIFDGDGNPLSCGPLASFVETLAAAEVGAALTLGRVPDAFAALARDGWYFGKLSTAAKQKLERSVLAAVEPKSAQVTPLAPRPASVAGPHYSPLAFDAQGALWVQTAQGMVRVAPDGSVTAPLPADSGTRSLEVVLASGRRLRGVAYSCDRSETTLLFDAGEPLVTPLLAPRPGACGRSAFVTPLPVTPIAVEGEQLLALVGGSVVGAARGSPPGSPRSPDGRWLVVPTSFGLLLEGSAHRLLGLGKAVEQPLSLTDCVAANDGVSAACISRGQALLVRGAP